MVSVKRFFLFFNAVFETVSLGLVKVRYKSVQMQLSN